MSSTLARLAGAVLALAACAAAGAGGPQTWFFDASSAGEDVSWVSPTPVDPAAPAYRADYELTSIVVTVSIFGFPTPIDVTDQVRLEDRSGSGKGPGPAPIVLIDQPVVVPEPPEPPAVQAHLFVGLDGGGFGSFAASDVALGTYDLGFPFGEVTILAIALAGEITVTPFDPADVNGDGAVNVADLVAVITAWGACPAGDCPADTNWDGLVDVQDLVQIITSWG